MLGGAKNFSVGICDGTPSTARSSWIYVHLSEPMTVVRRLNVRSKLKVMGFIPDFCVRFISPLFTKLWSNGGVQIP